MRARGPALGVSNLLGLLLCAFGLLGGCYGGLLLGPPLVGGPAELVGLRAAMGTIALAGLAIFVLSARTAAKER